MELGHGKCGSLLPPRQHPRGVHGILHDSAVQGVLQYRLYGEAEEEIFRQLDESYKALR